MRDEDSKRTRTSSPRQRDSVSPLAPWLGYLTLKRSDMLAQFAVAPSLCIFEQLFAPGRRD